MKSRLEKQLGAYNRFSILSRGDWIHLKAPQPDDSTLEQYEEYVARKEKEKYILETKLIAAGFIKRK